MSSPASSSTPGRSLPTGWRAWALVLGATGAASLAATYLRYRTRSRALREANETTDDMPPLEPKPKTKAAADAPAKKARAPVVAAAPRTWTENEFGSAAQQFLERLGQTNQVDANVEAALRGALHQVLAFSNEARALASHFLLATNAFYLTESASEKEFDALMSKQAVDMQLAWQLLDCPESTPDQSRALDVMRIQVTQCLKDATRMLPIFARMTARPIADLNDEELILLFTTAPLLGRWERTIELGDRLATMHDLSDFHNAPMDYQVLYELARAEQQTGDVALSQLQWKNYKIAMQRIKLREAECEDEHVLASLEGEFSHEGARTWKILPVHDALRLVRCGALCQLRSFSPVPLALVGPASDTRIVAQGYAHIGEAAKQTETYHLTRVTAASMEGAESSSGDEDATDAVHWKGTYTMVQEPILDEVSGENTNGMPTLRVTFDFEMAIQLL